MSLSESSAIQPWKSDVHKDAARRILELTPDAKIIFVTQESCPGVVEEALGLGAQGYVLKSEMETDLVPALYAAIQGKRFISGRGPDNTSGN